MCGRAWEVMTAHSIAQHDQLCNKRATIDLSAERTVLAHCKTEQNTLPLEQGMCLNVFHRKDAMDSWPFAFERESPWGRCYASFLRHAEELSGSINTRDLYERTLRAFFRAPAKLPDRYSREDVEAFIRHTYRGKLPTAATINSRLAILSSFYKYAAGAADERGAPLLSKLPPTSGLSRLRPERVHHTISYEDFARLFAAIPDTVQGLRDRALFLTYFWTARRRCEVLALTVGDLEYGVIIDENGGRRSGWLYHFRGKGRSRQDDVAELPNAAKMAIDSYLVASGRVITPDSPLFVPMHRAERPLSHGAVWAALKRYARLAGLDPASITIHSFRHTAARERYEAGSDIREIQQLLRHRSLATTDIYLRELTGTADPGAKRLEEKFGKFTNGHAAGK